MKKRLLSIFLCGCALAINAKPAPTVLSITESIKDDAIVYPESFETDTQELLQNWYLKNYIVLDNNVENKSSNDVTDQEYIKRLKAIPTTIEMPYNQVVRSYIDMYVNKRRTFVEGILGLSLYYMPIFEQALEKEGLPLELKYLPVIESALNPNAVSRVGATGLWQFMLHTAKGLEMEVSTIVDERRDPYRSSENAAKYLKTLYGIYNNWSLAIAAYNCGPGNINKAMRRAGGGDKDFWEIYPYLPAETRGYVPAFIAATYIMTYHNQHNISPALAKRPLITDTVHVNKRVHLRQISEVLNIPLEEIQILNPHFRKEIIPGDNRPYILSLPSQQIYSYIMSEDSIMKYNEELYARREVVEPASFDSYSKEDNDDVVLVVKYHKVKRGETISAIAKRYDVSTSSIKAWNNLRRNSLQRGQTLKINTYRANKNTDEEVAEDLGQEEILASNNTSKSAVKETTFTDENNDEVAPTKTKNSKKAVEPKDETTTAKSSKKNKKETVEETASTKNKKDSKNKKDAEEETVTAKNKKGNKDKKDTASSSKKDKKSSGKKTHTVRSGENLYVIAERYKGVSVADIQKANKLKNSKLKPGQKLIIPSN